MELDPCGSRPEDMPDPMKTHAIRDHELVMSLFHLGSGVILTLASYAIPLFKPFVDPDWHAGIDFFTANFCKTGYWIGVGLLGIRAGRNLFRALDARDRYNDFQNNLKGKGPFGG